MHIPDGFIDMPTAALTGAVSLGVVAYSVRRIGRDLGERTVPLLGVTAAFIFAAQMVNFPIAGGTSGHVLGATLAAALMGPWAATVVMTVVVVVQALGMADGGLTALGANIVNMGIVAVLAGWGLLNLLKKLVPRSFAGYLVALAVASWTSVIAAAAAASLELGVSATVPLRAALPAMLSVHMVIGLGEALITCAVVAAVLAARPDLVASLDPGGDGGRGTEPTAAEAVRLSTRTAGRMRFWSFIGGALVVATALAVFIAPFASGAPDGLERVAVDEGFETAAAGQPAWDLSPLGDYRFPWISDERAATAAAGLTGTIMLFAVVLLIGRTVGRRRFRSGERSDSG